MSKDPRKQKTGPDWPTRPIAVSPIEGIIESFWNPALDASSRWRCDSGALTAYWDAHFFEIPVTAEGTVASISRPYRIDLEEYTGLRARLRPGRGVRTRVIAEVDGQTVTVADETADEHGAVEIAGPVDGNRLSGVTLEFTVESAAAVVPPENEDAAAANTHAVQLRWVMLEGDARERTRWRAPERPFAGMLAEEEPIRFEPGLGLIFGTDELAAMRQYVADPLFDEVWRNDLGLAAEQFRVDPESMIRQYSLYAHTRYGRPWDDEVDTGNDGLLLALVGLITQDASYMRQAARHALVFAHIDEWAEGFVDRMPGYFWYHSNFAPNVATIKTSLLLDWTWHWLSPAGRDFIKNAIIEKGLRRLEGAEDRMANQGARFVKGLVLGRMAIAEDYTEETTQRAVRGFLAKLDQKIESVSRPDGTFSEGMGYGTGTMASLPITYVAAGRCLGEPVADLVSDRFLPSMRFILTATRGIAPSFAAFCAGPLGDDLFADQCVPTGVLAGYRTGESISTGGNSCEYVFYGLIPVWAEPLPEAGTPRLPQFSLYRDGGWVFFGNDEPEAPRISFESGLWDGHGHAWYHKHAVTADAWGERILITRHHLSYEDARSRHTMSTRFYNTFAPGGRDQDASGTPGRGAVLSTAKDRGPIAFIESDNAGAWKHHVTRAVRRVLFIRPNVVIVADAVDLDAPEAGVQSWNSFAEWETIDGRSCITRVGETGARLTTFGGAPFELSAGEASVHNENGTEMPVYRSAYVTEPSETHRLLTVIEILPPGSSHDGGTYEAERSGARGRVAAAHKTAQVEVISEEDPVLEVTTGSTVVRIAPSTALLPGDGLEIDECSTEGEFVYAVGDHGGDTH